MPAGSGSAQFSPVEVAGRLGEATKGVAALALALFGYEQGKATDQAIRAAFNDLQGIAFDLVEFITAVLWWAAHMGTATSELAGYMGETGAHLETIERDHLAAWREFLDVQYPRDLRDLFDRLSAKLAAQGKVNLKPIEDAIKQLQANDRREEQWRKNVVDPDLNQWDRFYGTWKSTYMQPLTVLIGWLAKPATFAAFALPPVTAGLPSFLRRSESADSARAIETALLATWQAQPQTVWGLVQSWLVSDT